MARDSNAHTVSIVSASSSLATQAAAMSSGQWSQISGVSGLGLFTGQPGSDGLVIAFMDKLARDPTNRKIYAIGCDHGAQTLFLVYDESTNAWTEQASSVPWGIEAGSTTSHGYNHSVFDHVHGKLYHRPYSTRAFMRWDGGTTWATLSYASNLFYNAATAGCAFFPDMGANGRLVIYQLENGLNGGVVSIDPVTQVVTTHDGGTSLLSGTGDPHCWMLYSPQRACVVFGGGNGSRKVWRMNASGTITALNDVPSAITADVGPNGDPCAVPFVNPSNGNIVVIQSANNWVELNPLASSGSQWSTKSGTVSMLSSNTRGAAAYGVAAVSIPEYGGVGFIKNWTRSSPAQFWFWKS